MYKEFFFLKTEEKKLQQDLKIEKNRSRINSFFRGIDIENGYIPLSINQSNYGDEICKKSKIFLKNRLAKRWDMWLNSRALTERQASEGTDEDLENNTK